MMKTFPGPNTRLVQTPLGEMIGSPLQRGAFPHPFKAALAGGGLRFSKGVVLASIAHEPTIGGVPISGNDRQPAPILKLDPKVPAAPARAESWACLEITPNEDGSTDKDTLVEIVHRPEPAKPDAKTGRHPICLILWQAGVPVRVIAFTMFNLQYIRTTPAAGQGIPRHFFR